MFALEEDVGLRFRVDYLNLNAPTQRFVYPIPLRDDIIDSLGKPTSFKLAANREYWQVEIRNWDWSETILMAHDGLYGSMWIRFGL